MKKWIVWLKKNSPWLFLLIVPVLNFYLLEWYTHNPFQTMKPYIQGMNLALFEFAALFLFALTGRISRALGIETAFCAVYGLANYFVLEFRGAPIQPWDILSISTAASVADNYEYKLNRTGGSDFGTASSSPAAVAARHPALFCCCGIPAYRLTPLCRSAFPPPDKTPVSAHRPSEMGSASCTNPLLLRFRFDPADCPSLH